MPCLHDGEIMCMWFYSATGFSSAFCDAEILGSTFLKVFQLRAAFHGGPRDQKKPIEEELIAGDRLKYFHPTKPGDVLGGRFRIIAKLGFGGGSTVWLAENLK